MTELSFRWEGKSRSKLTRSMIDISVWNQTAGQKKHKTLSLQDIYFRSCWLLQWVQSWSSGSWRRTRLFSCPVLPSWVAAAWWAFVFTTAALTAKPPCCPCRGRANLGLTWLTVVACCCVEGCAPHRSMWLYLISSLGMQECTYLRWATQMATVQSTFSLEPRRFYYW